GQVAVGVAVQIVTKKLLEAAAQCAIVGGGAVQDIAVAVPPGEQPVAADQRGGRVLVGRPGGNLVGNVRIGMVVRVDVRIGKGNRVRVRIHGGDRQLRTVAAQEFGQRYQSGGGRQ